jgi:spermidine synthase
MEYVELARAHSERGEVVLRQRLPEEGAALGTPTVLELRVNGVHVMDSAENSSEVALARTALDRAPTPASVLVGGLGLGFTAHEVLADPRVERVVVAEIEESLVGWFRDGTIPHGPLYLADQRLAISVADVQQVIAESGPETFDLILLDVDNGPDFLVHQQNAALYEAELLQQAWQALRPDGVLVVWSSTESERLTETLREIFEEAGTEPCPVVLQGRQETYWLHSAHKHAHPSLHHRSTSGGTTRD